ncbi:MAG: ACT domain-containing protein [Gemmataceae bacterium]
MRTHTGVAERMFAALADAGVNLKMITTGDIKISVLVDKDDGIKSLRAVHQAFQLEQPRPGAGKNGSSKATTFRARTKPLPESSRDIVTVSQNLASMEDILVSDVLLDADQGRITLFDLPNGPAAVSKIFQGIASAGIVVDMIVLSRDKQGKANLSFSVPKADLDRGLKIAQQLGKEADPAVRVAADAEIARLIVIGVGMRTHTGVARRMFGALAEKQINIAMINTSEVRLSVVVDGKQGTAALTSLKAAFQIP